MFKLKDINPGSLSDDPSGTQATNQLRKLGWKAVPVISFGEIKYAILFNDPPHPGANTAEVINVTRFNNHPGVDEPMFKILVTTSQQRSHTEGWAWIYYCDEGMAVLTVYKGNGKLHEFTHPATAVLSYRIVPPTRDDIDRVANQLDDELQEGGVWLR